MPVLEVEIGDDGKPVKVPAEVQKLIDQAHGYGRAEERKVAAETLKTEIERLKKAGELSPADKERLKTLELDLSKAREDIALRDKDFEKAKAEIEGRHASALKERDDKLTASAAELEKRTERIRQAVLKEVIAIAAVEGARKESLPELEVLLGSRIGLDDGLQAFVRDAKDPGKAALEADGKTPVTVEGFVKQYLADHAHHRAAVSGRGGGARGGRENAGGSGGAGGEKATAIDDVSRNPSIGSVAAALKHIKAG